MGIQIVNWFIQKINNRKFIVIVYIDFSDGPYNALEASVETCRLSGESIDDISLDWCFYQYSNDAYNSKRYAVI